MRQVGRWLLLALGVLPASSQTIPIGTWKSSTSMMDVRDGARLGSVVVGATSGGLFLFDRTDGAFRIITNAEGLATNDLTAVGTDPSGSVWIGGEGGELHVFDPQDDTMQDIMDIAQSPRLEKAIRAFVPHGDTVFIVTSFGVSVYRTDKWEFGDTYANFPISAAPFIRDAAVYNDSLWIASQAGLLVGWLGNLNLSAPSSWSLVPAGNLPSGAGINALVVYRDTLYIGTSNGLGVNGGTGCTQVPALAGRSYVRLIPDGDRLFSLSGVTSLYRHSYASDPGTLVNVSYLGDVLDAVVDADAGQYWLMTPSRGMLTNENGSWVEKNPDVPRIGVFYDVAIDDEGKLWAGTGIDLGGQGFARFDPAAEVGKRWKTFNVSTDPILGSNDYYKVNPVSGAVWISSWGNGTVEVRADSIVRRLDAQSTPALASSDANSTFPVIGGIAEDASGVIWIVNRTAVNGNVLAKLLPDGSMEYQRNLLPGGEGRFTSMVIDRLGTKWLANSEPTKKAATGLYYFNEDLLVDGTSATGGWGLMTFSDGLANNTVISLTVDLDGDVWIGTDLGVTIITNPRSPRSRRVSSFPLREQSIQSIGVDAVNRKWVGTKEGVLVVSPDGSRLLEQYTVASTVGALIDDDVRSIAIDQDRGIVYMGTEKGLSALTIAAVRTERNYSTLEIGPNPFLIPGSGELTVGNLVENSTIKILTIDGRKVTEFEAQGGGRAFWNGQDDAGAMVASGVYIIIAFADNGEQVTQGKVVVVRR